SVKSVINDYEATSGVKIDLTIIPDAFESNTLTKWAAGQRPDIIFFQPSPGFLSQLNPAKNLQDLGDLPFATETKFGLEESGSLDGTHYTATYGFPSVFGVYYNKKVFADNGIDVPKTTADLDAAAVALKAAGVTPFGITGGDSWTGQIGFISAVTDTVADGGAEAVNDGTASFTDAPFVEAAAVNPERVSKQWVNDDYLTALYADVPQKLQDGNFAMYPMASWLSASFTDASNIGFFPYPSSSGKVQWQSSNNASVQLPKTGDSAKEAAARDFVNYLTVGDGYKALIAASGEPSIIEGVDDPAAITPLAKAAADAFAAGGVASLDQQLLYSPSERATLLGSVLAGTLTPKEFGAQYQDAFDKLKALQGN
ncbi:extracellular solute-binding protein, partial [Salinibacterium sp.]|uniref:ABC transporter substrate-binding protein n=1 Tax=Salinibacterium sp. TaxID=1915057 RepID=UPI00286C49E6